MPMVDSGEVSRRGRLVLPAEVLRRWDLTDGGVVQLSDLGDALLITPVDIDGLRRALRAAIDDRGGYSQLAASTTRDDPDLS